MSRRTSDPPAAPTEIPAKEVLRQFRPLVRRDRGFLLAACVLAAVAVVAEVAVVLVFMEITDRVLETRDMHAFWRPALLWIVFTAVGAAATFGKDMLVSQCSEHFLLRLRDQVFGHVQSMSPDFFSSRDTGDLVVRITGDIDAVEGLVVGGFIHLVTNGFSVLLFAGTALYLRWDLALVSFAVAPLFWLVTRGFTTPFAKASRRERAGNGVIAAVVEENVTNMMLVQAYNRPGSERERVHAAGIEWFRARMAEARLSALYSTVIMLTETVCVLAVLGFGAWELSEKRIDLGGLLAFAAFLGMLFPPVQGITSYSVLKSTAGAGAQRLMEVLGARPAVADLAQTGMYSVQRGLVEFDSVTFRYPGKDEPALSNVSLAAGPGRLVLVTGASGAGKSTITRLLLRFHDPEHGAIRLDGADIRDLTLRRLRGTVTLLPQETLLFEGTVRDNIAYGDPAASDARIAEAARIADAAEFIEALPQGYETMIGQNGSALSGGQRQRLAIARAMLRDTPILVLDEPTTGLDARAAHNVLAPLRRLMAGRTTILISHDLHMAADADEILVVEHGRITQRGTHAKLVAAAGKYAELWAAQGRRIPQQSQRPHTQSPTPEAAAEPEGAAELEGAVEPEPRFWRPEPAQVQWS